MGGTQCKEDLSIKKGDGASMEKKNRSVALKKRKGT